MKAVIYHANAKPRFKQPEDFWEVIVKGYKANVNSFGIPLVHLTIDGHPGWGDENYSYPGDVEDVVWNREVCFTQFLKDAPEDVYWFGEPDSELLKPFPELAGDLAIVYRGSYPRICPAWRLAKKSALPFFELILEEFDENQKRFHGDSVAFDAAYDKLSDLGVKIELRQYNKYIKKGIGMFVKHHLSFHKLELYERIKSVQGTAQV